MSRFATRGIGSSGDLVERLMNLLVEAEADSADRPHILICSGQSGVTSYMGPFPTALAAMAAAEEQQQSWGYIEEHVAYSVALLLTP